jgi:hypothetical protein
MARKKPKTDNHVRAPDGRLYLFSELMVVAIAMQTDLANVKLKDLGRHVYQQAYQLAANHYWKTGDPKPMVELDKSNWSFAVAGMLGTRLGPLCNWSKSPDIVQQAKRDAKRLKVFASLKLEFEKGEYGP